MLRSFVVLLSFGFATGLLSGRALAMNRVLPPELPRNHAALCATLLQQASPGFYRADLTDWRVAYNSAPEYSGRQRQSNWCWAASAQMVLSAHGIPAVQEQLVARVFGYLVDHPATAAQIEAALSGWVVDGAMGMRFVTRCGRIVAEPALILSELQAGRPLIAGIATGPGAGHAVVVTGVTFDVDPWSGQILLRRVIYRDPWPGSPSRNEVTWLDFAARLQSLSAFDVVRVH